MLPSLVYVIKVYDFISTFVNPMIKKLDSLVNQKHIRYMVGDNDFTTTKSSDKCLWFISVLTITSPVTIKRGKREEQHSLTLLYSDDITITRSPDQLSWLLLNFNKFNNHQT